MIRENAATTTTRIITKILMLLSSHRWRIPFTFRNGIMALSLPPDCGLTAPLIAVAPDRIDKHRFLGVILNLDPQAADVHVHNL